MENSGKRVPLADGQRRLKVHEGAQAWGRRDGLTRFRGYACSLSLLIASVVRGGEWERGWRITDMGGQGKRKWVKSTEAGGDPGRRTSAVFCDNWQMIGRAGGMEKCHRSHLAED